MASEAATRKNNLEIGLEKQEDNMDVEIDSKVNENIQSPVHWPEMAIYTGTLRRVSLFQKKAYMFNLLNIYRGHF